MSDPQHIAIRARVIRRKLLSRNRSLTFCAILQGISDNDLISLEEMHHQETILWLKERNKTECEHSS
jgi:hypothetical protein